MTAYGFPFINCWDTLQHTYHISKLKYILDFEVKRKCLKGYESQDERAP